MCRPHRVVDLIGERPLPADVGRGLAAEALHDVAQHAQRRLEVRERPRGEAARPVPPTVQGDGEGPPDALQGGGERRQPDRSRAQPQGADPLRELPRQVVPAGPHLRTGAGKWETATSAHPRPRTRGVTETASSLATNPSPPTQFLKFAQSCERRAFVRVEELIGDPGGRHRLKGGRCAQRPSPCRAAVSGWPNTTCSNRT